MRSKTFTRVIATTVFSALTVSAPLVAREQGAEQQHKKDHHRYKFIDIGTFGGPASFVNPVANGGPYISQQGA
jgi:hypothetical protein